SATIAPVGTNEATVSSRFESFCAFIFIYPLFYITNYPYYIELLHKRLFPEYKKVQNGITPFLHLAIHYKPEIYSATASASASFLRIGGIAPLSEPFNAKSLICSGSNPTIEGPAPPVKSPPWHEIQFF